MNNSFLNEFLLISSSKTIIFLLILSTLFGITFILKKKHVSFSSRMLISTVIGIILGFIIQFVSGFHNNPMEITWVNETTKWFSLFGNGFIDLIRMLVIPLIIVSIIHIIINMKQDAKIKQLTLYSIIILFVLVSIAAIVGIIIAIIFNLGSNSIIEHGSASIKEITPLVDVLRNLIPNNPIKSMSESNVIAVVIFSIFIGIAARKMSNSFTKTMESFSKFMEALHKIVISITMSVINLMPYAVIPLLANTIAQRGLKSVLDVIMFIVALYVAILIMFLFHIGTLAIFGVNPIIYIKKALPVLVLSFTSRSSLGCMPLTIETLETMGVNPSTSTFVASFGATTGMNGCAGIFPGMLIITVANMTGNPIDLSFLIMAILVITISSIGIAGVPGTATTSASINLSAVGFGQYFDITSPILAVDPILDMGRTFINVNGVLTTAIMVDKKLKQFDLDKFKDKNSKIDGTFM